MPILIKMMKRSTTFTATNIPLIVLLCILSALCVACGRNTTGKKPPVQFELPEVPVMLSPEARGAFIAQHFWDKFDFNDTVSLWGDEMQAEQIFADYTGMLWQLNSNEAARSIRKMLEAAEAAGNPTFARFLDLCEKYFYDPNSPMRNDELYIPVLEYIIASPSVAEIDRLRPQNLLEMALKNRTGTKAADFTYTVFSGDTGTLYDISADYTILFFNNPDCQTCKSVREEISAIPLLTEMVQSGQLKILALYPDEDLTAWQNYRHNIPATWINGYDKTQAVSKQSIYDLKAIPTLYLLSADKTVLVKDALSPMQIVQYLEYNQ